MDVGGGGMYWAAGCLDEGIALAAIAGREDVAADTAVGTNG